MSGHSKWSTIKRQKNANDSKRANLFTKLANAIAIAAREGGASSDHNFALRLMIDKAKASNMPAQNIEKAIKRGMGRAEDGAKIEEVVLEGFGPGGVAILLKTLTDNRNRTLTEVKTILNRHGGKLAGGGAVSYQFSLRGLLTIEPKDFEELFAISAKEGALDVIDDEEAHVVQTEPKDLMKVKRAIEQAGMKVLEVELSFEPLQTVKAGQGMTELLEALEDQPEVVATYTNADFSD